jgi:polyketide synthase PksN
VAETWLDTALPTQSIDWVAQLSRQGGKRILVIYEDERDHEAMNRLLGNIGAIVQETPQTSPLNYHFLKVTGLETSGQEGVCLNKTDQAGLTRWLQGQKVVDSLPAVIFCLAAKGNADRADLRFFFHLSQGLLREAGDTPIQGYYLFEADAATPRLELEALSGLTRSLALENPNHRYRTIGVAETLSADQKAICLLNEWLLDNLAEPATPVHYRSAADDRRDILSLSKGSSRGLDRFVPALQEIELASTGSKPAFRQEAVYLITGGLGGIGQQLCEYLSKTYHTTLIILARSPLGQTQQRQIEQIEGYGGKVWYFPVDIADRQALQQTLSEVKKKAPQIDGVIHLARQVEDGLLVHKRFERFEQVIKAKVEGTLYLDEVTQAEPLDFFLLFSSLAAYGLKGSADYAYATAFQNGFARWRQAQVQSGRRSGRTRAVCWGQWAIDRYSEAGRNQFLKQVGFELLTPETGLPLLEQSLVQENVVIGAMAAADKGKLKALLGISAAEAGQDNSNTLFEQIVLDLKEARRSREEVLELMAEIDLNTFSDQQIDVLHALLLNYQPTEASTGGPLNTLPKMTMNGEAAPPQPVMPLVTSETLPEVKDARTLILMNLQKVLKVDAQAINAQEPFQNYGLDSITGMQLAVALEKSLGLEILPKWLVEYPTVDSLAKKLQTLKQ